MIRVFSFCFRHPRSGQLFFRMAVPRRLQPLVGRREIKKSLRTADKAVAVPAAMGKYAYYQEVFRKLEAASMSSKKKNHGYDPIKADDALKNLSSSSEGSAGLITVQSRGADGSEQTITFDTGDPDKDFEQAHNWAKAALPKGAGRWGSAATTVASVDSIRLSEACRKYREEKLAEGAWTSKTAEEHEATHAIMLQLFRDVEIATITRPHARRLKEMLMGLPPNHSKRYPGKTIKQIMALSPADRISTKTLNDNYLQRYSSLFSWAKRQGYCADNPFEGMKLRRTGRPIDDKEPFSADDLRKIFSPKTFNKEHLKDPWKYWLPLIALYSGARRQEIAQLRSVDVITIDGIDVIRITSEAGPLKNESSNRIVPIHPELKKCGFLEFVEQMHGEGHERLFPDLYRVKSIKAGEKVGRWFNGTYLRVCGLKPTDRKISFHSFRHSFTDALKKRDVPETKAAQICGRAHGSITYGRYGGDHDLSSLFEVISQVQFDLRVNPWK